MSTVVGMQARREFEELPEDLVHHFNTAADRYYRNFANAAFETNKPFANYREAAMISYQVGLLLSVAKVGRAQRILEFGAGSGWLASSLHRLGNEVFLLDVSPTALQMARQTFQQDARHLLHDVGPHFDHYDGFQFPYADQQFDRVVCFDALHHVPNPGQILRECCRVLRTGGIAGFVESGEQHAELPAIRDCVAHTGILERSTRLEEIHALAHAAGFSAMTVKAFPAFDAWEIDYEACERARAQRPLVDPRDVTAGFSAGNQSIFALHKGTFEYDGTFPLGPAADFELGSSTIATRAAEQVTIDVRIENVGQTRFNVAPRRLGGYAALGAHLFRGAELVDFDFLRHTLSDDLPRGAATQLQVDFLAPTEAGQYRLEFDLVIEGQLWLGQAGSRTAWLELNVT